MHFTEQSRKRYRQLLRYIVLRSIKRIRGHGRENQLWNLDQVVKAEWVQRQRAEGPSVKK